MIWVVSPMLHDTESYRRLREEVIAATTAVYGPVRFLVVDDSAGTDADVASLHGFDDVQVLTNQVRSLQLEAGRELENEVVRLIRERIDAVAVEHSRAQAHENAIDAQAALDIGVLHAPEGQALVVLWFFNAPTAMLVSSTGTGLKRLVLKSRFPKLCRTWSVA